MNKKDEEFENKQLDILEILDQLTKWGEVVNGMKNQLTSSGWSEENAQMLVMHMIMNGGTPEVE